MKLKHVTAVVFDWAGTTVDHGSRAPAIVFQEIFRQSGVQITSAQARGPMGMAKRDHIAAILAMPEVAAAWKTQHGRAAGDDDIDALYREFLPLQRRVLADHSDVIAGVANTAAVCRDMGLKIGSTTGYTRELMETVTRIAAEQGYRPDCVLCAEDAPRGRPAPYLLYQAAMRLDVYPLSTVINVDDTPAGMAAGRHAGCWNIGVTRTGNCVGLSASEIDALPEPEVAALCAAASRTLTDAGAHFSVGSVAEIPDLIVEIDRRLECGEMPASVAGGGQA